MDEKFLGCGETVWKRPVFARAAQACPHGEEQVHAVGNKDTSRTDQSAETQSGRGRSVKRGTLWRELYNRSRSDIAMLSGKQVSSRFRARVDADRLEGALLRTRMHYEEELLPSRRHIFARPRCRIIVL